MKLLNNHPRKGTASRTESALDSIDRRGDSHMVLRVLLLALEVPFYRRAPLFNLIAGNHRGLFFLNFFIGEYKCLTF